MDQFKEIPAGEGAEFESNGIWQ